MSAAGGPRPTACLRLRAAALLFLGFFSQTPAFGKPDLEPSSAQIRATELVLDLMEEHHYKRMSLDNTLSSKILDSYLVTLDPNRSYLLASDVARFEQWRHRLDDSLNQGDLLPAFSMFHTFRRRVQQRVRFAIQLLDGAFDFNLDEDYELDRSKQPWAENVTALDEIWRKRVKNDVLILKLAGKTEADIKRTLRQRYEDLGRRTEQLNAEDIHQFFMNAYTSSVEPHTSYLSPRASENFLISMSLSLEGIGAVLQSENEFTLVRKVVPGGPADQSKQLRPEDRIVGVGQGLGDPIVNVVGWRLDDVVDLIRGPKGTIVRLEVLPKTSGPEGSTKVITLTRRRIELEEQAAKSHIFEIPTEKTRIGIIRVPTFYVDFAARSGGEQGYRSTTRDVRALIETLRAQRVEGIVIDLRGNGGGSLAEATALTGLFIEGGPVVQVKDARGRIEVNADPIPGIPYTGPLAVLVDRHSASASEIFAAAIQDYQRGIVLGERTFGKGTVQNLIDLDRRGGPPEEKLGQLKVTIAQFFRVNGDSTQHRGVAPDITFPTALGVIEEGERALENALPWDHVRPLRFIPAHAPVQAFASVRGRHEKRVKDDPGFGALLEEGQLAKEAERKTRVSLLESKRSQEMQESKTSQHEREARIQRALGLTPAVEREGAADEQPEMDPSKDVLLKEAAYILGDLIVKPKLKASRQPPGQLRYGRSVVGVGWD
ncbi:MAG: carboxy terminal-processing peptidase [Gammaproteobacteria bacterium]